MKIITLSMTFLLAIAAFGVVVAPDTGARAGNNPPCTKTGDDGPDFLAGTRHRDVICGRGGKDFIVGKAGGDRLRGDGGRDRIVGGGGRDVIRGNGGNDILFSVNDGKSDRVFGGHGFDRCFVDPEDERRGCEIVHVGPTSNTTSAMTSTIEAETTAAETVQDCFPAEPSCEGD